MFNRSLTKAQEELSSPGVPMWKSPTHRAWTAIKGICTNPNHTSYKGDLGYELCTRWFKFENFYEDMGKKPEGFMLEITGTTYSKESCRWVPFKKKGGRIRPQVVKPTPKKTSKELFNVWR